VALAMDFLGIAVAELANISERRIERFVNPMLSWLPAFRDGRAGNSLRPPKE
jgi:histidine ammonia-lyase